MTIDNMGQQIRLFFSSDNNPRTEITDLYFFEEEGIHDLSGEGHSNQYKLELEVNGKVVWDNKGVKETWLHGESEK